MFYAEVSTTKENKINISSGCKSWLEAQAKQYGVEIDEIIFRLWTMVDEEGVNLDDYSW